MRHRRTQRAMIALLAVLALIAGACGNDDDTGVGPGTDDDPGNGDVTEPTDPVDEGEAQYGGRLNYGMYQEVQGFDPVIRGGNGHPSYAIYDTLLIIDDDGNAAPHMAESIESDDFQTWTLTLREGIEFHDGTPLDADAVVFNIERHLDPDANSPVIGDVASIESVEAIDDLTVQFNLRVPVAAFPTALAGGAGMIASPTAIEELGEDYNTNPVGAGPFVFAEWLPDDRTLVTRNENYWQEGLPYLDEIAFQPRPDTQTRQESILGGDVDMVWHLTAREIRQGQESDDIDVYLRAGNGAEGILLNPNEPPFDDLRMRQALAHAMDYQSIADVRFDGEMERARSPIGEESPFFRDTSDMYPDYDPERARELIEEYRAEGNDPNFTFSAPNTPDRILFGEMVQQVWGDVGLEVELEFLDITEYVDRVLQQTNFQASINTMPNFAHPYPNVFNNFHSEGSSNFGNYANPEMDEALETARSSPDEDERAEAWGTVQEIMATDLPWVFYARNATALLTNPDLRGVVFTPQGIPYYHEMWFDAS